MFKTNQKRTNTLCNTTCIKIILINGKPWNQIHYLQQQRTKNFINKIKINYISSYFKWTSSIIQFLFYKTGCSAVSSVNNSKSLVVLNKIQVIPKSNKRILTQGMSKIGQSGRVNCFYQSVKNRTDTASRRQLVKDQVKTASGWEQFPPLTTGITDPKQGNPLSVYTPSTLGKCHINTISSLSSVIKWRIAPALWYL